MINNEKDEFPTVINGIEFDSQEDYDNRIQQDVEALAILLYDIYVDRKLNEK